MDALNAPDTPDNLHHLDSPHKLAPQLTPRGHLLAMPQDDAPPLAPHISQELQDAFALGSGHGLLRLGPKHVGQALPPAWAWWRAMATRYVTALWAIVQWIDPQIRSARCGRR